jgi:hypothetical protein
MEEMMLGFGGSRTVKSGRMRLGGRVMGEDEVVEQALNRRYFDTFLNISTTATPQTIDYNRCSCVSGVFSKSD